MRKPSLGDSHLSKIGEVNLALKTIPLTARVFNERWSITTTISQRYFGYCNDYGMLLTLNRNFKYPAIVWAVPTREDLSYPKCDSALIKECCAVKFLDCVNIRREITLRGLWNPCQKTTDRRKHGGSRKFPGTPVSLWIHMSLFLTAWSNKRWPP